MTTDQLTATFAALANPTRRAMLARLAQGDATVRELAEPLPITMQAVSQHLGVLERSGLITRSRNAQLRPSRLQAADPEQQHDRSGAGHGVGERPARLDAPAGAAGDQVLAVPDDGPHPLVVLGGESQVQLLG